jgi:hypothetical protein
LQDRSKVKPENQLNFDLQDREDEHTEMLRAIRKKILKIKKAVEID